MWINGKFTQGTATDHIAIINPATEDVVAEVAHGTVQDALAAVQAARDALPEWKRTPANQRAQMLHQVAASMRQHHAELVRLLTQEEGKPLPENEEEIWWAEETFDYYAELARHQAGWSSRLATPVSSTLCCASRGGCAP